MPDIRQYFYKPLTVSEVIEIAKEFIVIDKNAEDNFPYLYSNFDSELELDTICYLGEGVEVTDDSKEIYPKFIQENNLWVLCQGWYFIEQLEYVSEQKENFSNQDFLDALNYYLDKDTYLEFD